MSDKDQAFQLIFQETRRQKETSVHFNKEIKVGNETSNNIGFEDGEQATLRSRSGTAN